MNTEYLFILSIIMAVPFMGGCCLIYDYDDCASDVDGEFFVDADWKYASTANPEGMAYIFFSAYGHDKWRFDFPGRGGGEAELPDGEYSVLMFNDDTSRIIFRNSDNYSDFTFYCRRGGLYDGLGGTIDNPIGPDVTEKGENVEICPDMLWCDTLSCFRLYSDGTMLGRTSGASNVYNGDRSLMMYPRGIVARYNVVINNISNLEGVARICASLSGMASSLRPSDMYRGEAVTLPVKISKYGGDSAGGDFLTYGVPSDGNPANIFSLYVWLADGTKLCYEFDVGSQIRSADDPLDVSIILSGLDLPESGDPIGGGLDVSVDGWTTIVIDIQS